MSSSNSPFSKIEYIYYCYDKDPTKHTDAIDLFSSRTGDTHAMYTQSIRLFTPQEKKTSAVLYWYVSVMNPKPTAPGYGINKQFLNSKISILDGESILETAHVSKPNTLVNFVLRGKRTNIYPIVMATGIYAGAKYAKVQFIGGGKFLRKITIYK